MFKNIICFLLIVLLCKESFSQNMLTNIGIRIEGNEPSNIGLTLQRKIATHTNLEGIVHLSDNTFGFSGIYERYHNITSNYTLDFYYGGGVTVFFYSNIDAGISGIAALRYKFKNIPVNISVDWKPTFYIIDAFIFRPRQIGLSLRYTL